MASTYEVWSIGGLPANSPPLFKSVRDRTELGDPPYAFCNHEQRAKTLRSVGTSDVTSSARGIIAA